MKTASLCFLAKRRLREHLAEAKKPDGPLAEIDSTRPTMIRQRDDLLRAHANLLEQAVGLKWKTYHLAQSWPTGMGHRAWMRKVLRDTAPTVAQAFRGLERLVTELDRNQQTEARLILENATTDIGVGD